VERYRKTFNQNPPPKPGEFGSGCSSVPMSSPTFSSPLSGSQKPSIQTFGVYGSIYDWGIEGILQDPSLA